MPITKNQLSRFQAILGLMRKGKYVNYSVYQNEVKNNINLDKVSDKTFSRDIHALRDTLMAPIQYDASQKGFYLTDPDWTYADLPVETGDMKLFLLSEQVSRSFMPPQLRSELTNAVNALLIKQEGGIPEGMNLENFQILSPEFAPKVAPEVFLEVYQAWENKNYLKITYSSSSGHDSVKLIQPYVLAWNSGIWYIKGLVAKEDDVPCDPPFKIRVFALHRIQNAEKRPGRFFEDSEDAKRIKKERLFNFQTLDEVEIEFYPPFVKQMAERFISRPDAIVSQDENSLCIRLKNIPEYAALQLVFLAMGNARVLKPASLQESLGKVAQNIFDNLKSE